MKRFEEEGAFDGRLLLITTLLISICSIIYELLISGISTYLLGDSMKQYSITIGLYMSAMGIGSYLSRHIKKKLFSAFAMVEISTGVLGGFSSFVLFYANIHTEIYDLIMYVFIIGIGVLVGLEIPLLTRIIEENNSNMRVNLANIFTFDYIGGLIGSLAFPLLLYPKLGFITTSFLVGCINLFAANLILFVYRKYIPMVKQLQLFAGLILLMLISFLFLGQVITKQAEEGLYRDDIILSEQTMYQKIVMTKYKNDVRLYIDGNTQFSSQDEYRYHECLIHVPMSYVENPKRVLILGGGDGLAAREILKYDSVEEIVLVDIDPGMTELCRTNDIIKELNEGSLDNQKLTVINEDAYEYVENNMNPFEVVIVDLPDPNNESLNKLYTNVFYNYVKSNLTDDGIMVVQSTSPYYAPNSYWCIYKTISTQFDDVTSYHVQVPSFGEWGFHMAFKGKHEKHQLMNQLKFLNEENFDSLFIFGGDEKTELSKLEVNDIFKPALLNYYLAEEEAW